MNRWLVTAVGSGTPRAGITLGLVFGDMRTTIVLAVGAGIALRCGLWFVLGTTVVLAVETGIALRFVIDFVTNDFTAVVFQVKAIVASTLASFASLATVATKATTVVATLSSF